MDRVPFFVRPTALFRVGNWWVAPTLRGASRIASHSLGQREGTEIREVPSLWYRTHLKVSGILLGERAAQLSRQRLHHGVALRAGLVQNQKIIGVGSVFVVNATALSVLRALPAAGTAVFSAFLHQSRPKLFQVIDTRLGARHRRRTPMVHRGRAQRTISAGSFDEIQQARKTRRPQRGPEPRWQPWRPSPSRDRRQPET